LTREVKRYQKERSGKERGLGGMEIKSSNSGKENAIGSLSLFGKMERKVGKKSRAKGKKCQRRACLSEGGLK